MHSGTPGFYEAAAASWQCFGRRGHVWASAYRIWHNVGHSGETLYLAFDLAPGHGGAPDFAHAHASICRGYPRESVTRVLQAHWVPGDNTTTPQLPCDSSVIS